MILLKRNPYLRACVRSLSGFTRLQSPWICVVSRKRSSTYFSTPAAFSDFRLDHDLFAEFEPTNHFSHTLLETCKKTLHIERICHE